MKLLQSFEHFLARNIRYDYVYAARIFLVGKMSADNFEVPFFPAIQEANAISHIRNRNKFAFS